MGFYNTKQWIVKFIKQQQYLIIHQDKFMENVGHFI